MDGGLQVLGSIIGLATSIVLFLFLIFVLYRFLRWIWTRLPSSALSIQGPDLDKLLAVTTALIIEPGVAIFAWTTAQSLFGFIADQIRRLGDFNFGVSASCTNDFTSCVLSRTSTFIGQMADALVRA